MDTRIEKFTRFVAQEMAKPNAENTSLSVPVELLNQILNERHGAQFAAASHLRTVEQQRKIIEGMPSQQTDLAKRLLEKASRSSDQFNAVTVTKVDLVAICCEANRYYIGMMNWKRTAEAQPAAAPQQAVSVLDGWKLVPVEMTDEMEAAGDGAATIGMEHDSDLGSRGWLEDIHSVYGAMLAAAPQPPAATPAPTLTDAKIHKIALKIGMGTYSYEGDPCAYNLRFARAIAAHLTTAAPASKGE